MGGDGGMSFYIKGVRCDAADVIKRHGLDAGGRAQKIMVSELKRFCDPYVPFQHGHLKNDAFVGDTYLKYAGPYARFQYGGVVMVGMSSGSPWAKHGEKKIVTSRPLSYGGGGQRGAQWDKRMMAERGGEYVDSVAKAIGGKGKR